MAEGERMPSSPEDPRVQNARDVINSLESASAFEGKPMPTEEELADMPAPKAHGIPERRKPAGETILGHFVATLAKRDWKSPGPGSVSFDVPENDPEIESGVSAVVHYFLRGEKAEHLLQESDDPNIQRWRDGEHELTITRREEKGEPVRTFTFERLR